MAALIAPPLEFSSFKRCAHQPVDIGQCSQVNVYQDQRLTVGCEKSQVYVYHIKMPQFGSIKRAQRRTEVQLVKGIVEATWPHKIKGLNHNLSSNLNSLEIGIPTNIFKKFSKPCFCLFKPLMVWNPFLVKGAFNQ